MGSDSGLSVSYPKLAGQERTTDGATCRECDSALAAAASTAEQSDPSGSLCGKCAKRKGERKEIIRLGLFFNMRLNIVSDLTLN